MYGNLKTTDWCQLLESKIVLVGIKAGASCGSYRLLGHRNIREQNSGPDDHLPHLSDFIAGEQPWKASALHDSLFVRVIF